MAGAMRTSIWWDIENCPVPRGYDAHSIAYNIGEAIARAGYGGVVSSVSAYGDTGKISAAVQNALNSTGVGLRHVPPGVKDASDKKILVDMLLWAVDNPPPANYLLISGDRDFSNALHHLRMRRYNILLAHAPNVSQALVAAANSVWLWKSILAGGPPYDMSVSTSSAKSLEENVCTGNGDSTITSLPGFAVTLLPKEDVNGIHDHTFSQPQGDGLQSSACLISPLVDSVSSQAKPSECASSNKKHDPNTKLKVAPHKFFDSHKSDSSSSSSEKLDNSESDTETEVKTPPSELPRFKGNPSCQPIKNDFHGHSSNHRIEKFLHNPTNLPDISNLKISDYNEKKDIMPYQSRNCPQFNVNGQSQLSTYRPPQFAASSPYLLPGNSQFSATKPEFPVNYLPPYAANCPPRYSTNAPFFSVNHPQSAPNHSQSYCSAPSYDIQNHSIQNLLYLGLSKNQFEFNITVILRAIHILEVGKVPPTEVNIADCIHFGEMSLPNFNIKLGLKCALQQHLITREYAGAPLPVYTQSNSRQWKWVNIWDFAAIYPEATWNAVHLFLSSSTGHSAMLATPSSYEATTLLHKRCLSHRHVFGEVLHILNLAIKVKKWIVPSFSGWQPLTLNVACLCKS